MTEFLRLLPPAKARARLLSAIDGPLDRIELVGASEALDRVAAEDILAPHDLPEFRRSTVDGYAVAARDSFGASAAQPAYLRVTGEIAMGSSPSFGIGIGECAQIHTGGMLPEGADAVVMLESTQQIGVSGKGSAGPVEVEVLKPVASGENVITIGEDVRVGEIVISRGKRIRPQEIGGLMALGITSLRVTGKPRVALISSGDEIVEPHARPLLGQVRDVNSASLSALISTNGGEPVFFGVVPDEVGRLAEVARGALAACDVVVVTAGSSASTRDLTATAIESLGTPGVLVHGVNIRPGKPTILGACNRKAVIGLPGNPVSALIIARLFLVPVMDRLLGLEALAARTSVKARLAINLASQTGREDWWPVRIHEDPRNPREWTAEPIFGRSNLIFNLIAADGLVEIPADTNGLAAGELVDVELF